MQSFVRIALVVIALLVVGAGRAYAGTPIDQVTNEFIPAGSGGSIQAQSGKLQHGLPSSCSPQKAVPGVDSGSFNFDTFTEQSLINEPACLTVTFSTNDAGCQTNGLFAASYSDFFSPSAIESHYVGDVGNSPSNATPVSYSAPAAPGQFFDTDFHMSVAGAGCSQFDFTVSSDRPWAFTRPSIHGHPFAGETLTASPGSWAGAPSTTTQWRRCALDGSACADIAGATGTTYVAAPDDVGHALVARVTGMESGASSSSDSPPTVVGITLEALNGQSISGSEPTQHGRLLRNLVASRCGAPKAKPPVVDAGNPRFYDVFTRTNASDATLCTIVSLDTTTTCTGTGGATSAAYLPSFQPGTSANTNYLADGGASALAGGKTINYSFDVPAGASYDVVVSTFESGATCPAYDLRLGTTAPYLRSPPSITGTATEGQTLTIDDGAWTGTPTFSWQWERCFGDGSGCSDIAGATGNTYTLTHDDVGHGFRARVTATEGAGAASATTGPRGPVDPAPPVPEPPYAGMTLHALTVLVGRNGVASLPLECPTDAKLACAGTDTLMLGKTTIGSAGSSSSPGSTAS